MSDQEVEVTEESVTSSIKRSQDISKLALALAKAQGKIEGASKDRVNPHFGSRYATLASVWDACRVQLAEAEIAVVQAPSSDATNLVTVVTVLAHSSGQWMESTLSARPAKADAQGIGSVITYLRRYALSSMVGVAPEDDDDANAAVAPRTPQSRPLPPPKAPPQKPPVLDEEFERKKSFFVKKAKEVAEILGERWATLWKETCGDTKQLTPDNIERALTVLAQAEKEIEG